MLDRAGVEIELGTIIKAERQAYLAVLALVDAVTSEQHEVDAQGCVGQLDHEVLAPAAHGQHRLVLQAIQIHGLGIAFHLGDGFANEALGFIARDDE